MGLRKGKMGKVKIIDLNEKHEKLFFVCLEDWSEEMKEAGNHKEKWYEYMRNNGLIVKLAVDEQENVGGMIQFLPIEYSFVQGQELYFVSCIWVHGYKQGRGDFRSRGMGQALIQAAESEVRSRNAKGLVAWGISLPFWMKASWFKKQGYRRVDKMGFPGQVLLWKPFVDDAIPPRWIIQRKKPEVRSGKVTVTSFINGWCPAQNIVHERAKRASEELGDRVEFREIVTRDRNVFLEWGISDALFIDGKSVRTGPPPSYQKIRNMIARRIRKL